MPKVIQVIYSEIVVGEGRKQDPSRIVKQWHTLEGELICEKDEWAERNKNNEEE